MCKNVDKQFVLDEIKLTSFGYASSAEGSSPSAGAAADSSSGPADASPISVSFSAASSNLTSSSKWAAPLGTESWSKLDRSFCWDSLFVDIDVLLESDFIESKNK